MSQITAGVILVTLATGLIVPNAQDTGFLLLSLLGLWWLAGSGGWRRPGLSRAETAFVIVSLALVLAWWAAWWLHGLPDAGERSAQRVPKLLGAIVVLLLVRRCRNLAPAWWHGLTIGAWGAGIYALWYVLSGQVGHYEGRVEGPTNPIYFGGLSLAFCLMLLPRIADPEQPRTSAVWRPGVLAWRCWPTRCPDRAAPGLPYPSCCWFTCRPSADATGPPGVWACLWVRVRCACSCC